MNASPAVRYCRCGTYLGRANPGVLCAACQSGDRLLADESAPDVPLAFWDHPPMRDALQSRHMGRIIRAFRTHPHHGRKPLSQEKVAGWMELTQAQLSRTETGSPIVDIHRLTQWADALKIPSAYLWFMREERTPSEETEEMKRSAFLKLAGLAVAAPTLNIPRPNSAHHVFSETECAQWLAMELSKRQRDYLHIDDIPVEIAACLISYVAGNTMILRDANVCFSFAQPSLVAFYIAQQTFDAISSRKAGPFADIQTSHEVDLVIRKFVARDESSVQALTAWMRTGASPVLRVNSGGVLAKLDTGAAEEVLEALMSDSDMRHLYLTAVISRVLQVEWTEASRLASLSSQPNRLIEGIPEDFAGHLFTNFASEVNNPNDAVARWCSVLMLAQVQPANPDNVNQTLRSALMKETSTLNLRAIGSTLSGGSPLAS